MEQFVREALDRAQEIGNRRAQAICYNALGSVQYLRGRWPESWEAFQRSIELAQPLDATFVIAVASQRLAQVETATGRYAEAYERARRALTIAENSDNVLVREHSLTRLLATLVRNRFEAGDLAQAIAYENQGFTAQQEVGECVTCDVLLYPVAVPIFIASGDLTAAEGACRKAEEVAMAFRSQAWTAMARYLRGLLAAAQADWGFAADCLAEAVSMFESLGQPYDLARSLEALADVATKASPSLPHLSPHELRQRALEVYLRLGAQPDVERLSRPLA